MRKDCEIRFAGELRSGDEKQRRVSGHAAVFDVETEIEDFREVVRKGAFARALREKQDTRLLVNHDPNLILARSASGTLTLSEDSIGLKFSADLPNTQLGRDTWELVRRGDLSQCSFAFRTIRQNWVADLRELLDVDLFDASIVSYPAYPTTDVSARREFLAAECRNAKSFGVYPATLRPGRMKTAPSVRSASASEIERLKLRFRLLKIQQ